VNSPERPSDKNDWDPVIFFRRLREGAPIPAYQTEGAAGLDLCAFPEDRAPIRLLPQQRARVGTGLAVAIPPGYEGQVRPRSGWAYHHGVTLLNSPGTIDSDYRGEILVLLINLGHTEVVIQPGDRIAQLVIAPVCRAQVREATALSETARGSGGYGHTGGLR
jgi:dUTP pyrophosphatase